MNVAIGGCKPLVLPLPRRLDARTHHGRRLAQSLACELFARSGRARRIPARGLHAAPGMRHIELEPQGQVWTAEMVIGAPPLEMGEQFASELGLAQERRLRQGGQRMTQGKVDPLHKGGIERAGEPERFESVSEVREVAQTHAAFDVVKSAAAIGFFDLAIQQVKRHLPTESARSDVRDPLTEMGGDCIEVEVRSSLVKTGRQPGARTTVTAWSRA